MAGPKSHVPWQDKHQPRHRNRLRSGVPCGTTEVVPPEDSSRFWLVATRSSNHRRGMIQATSIQEPPLDTSAEFFETIVQGSGPWRLERILSFGQASPEGVWYDQAEDEWVLLVGGSATLEIEGQAPVELISGDHLILPAGKRHRVMAVSEGAVWLALHGRFEL
jgi:cupin 2 domain-containing protein